jgi:hypothetical protein
MAGFAVSINGWIWVSTEAYEREWRIIDSLFSADGDATDSSRDFWPFRFRPQAVKEIIVGHRAGAILPDIFDLLRQPRYEHVALFIARPDQKRFHLNFHELPRGGWGPGPVEGVDED